MVKRSNKSCVKRGIYTLTPINSKNRPPLESINFCACNQTYDRMYTCQRPMIESGEFNAKSPNVTDLFRRPQCTIYGPRPLVSLSYTPFHFPRQLCVEGGWPDYQSLWQSRSLTHSPPTFLTAPPTFPVRHGRLAQFVTWMKEAKKHLADCSPLHLLLPCADWSKEGVESRILMRSRLRALARSRDASSFRHH